MVKTRFVNVANGEIVLNAAVAGEGPLILCVHGFPELWWSWRHQLAHFSALGFTVAALDVRGYGGSSRPGEVAAYAMRALAGDVAAVIDALGEGRAILFGHDWGAPIVWNTALLHPDKVRAVAGLSVPYAPRGQASFLSIAKALYADRFFYQIYFQEAAAEAELERDPRVTLRKLYYSLSGDAPAGSLLGDQPKEGGLLHRLIDPEIFPAWMSEADLEVFVAAFTASGFRGPLNRYRAQDIDFEEMAPFAGAPVTQPAAFIAGDKDPVRSFIPGLDLYAAPGAALTDFRGATILPGIGHWVQQEAPQATNAALEAFVRGL
jgi:pimeloyl-ACP methyl ester carboxylesterase